MKRIDRRSLWLIGLITMALGLGSASAAQDADQKALLGRIRELMEASGQTRFVTPTPGSRSVILAIDVSTPLYLFLERGSIRGAAIDKFYQAHEAGDMDAAFDAFRAGMIPTVRVTDYGWNGLGVMLITDSGNQIPDIVYRDVEGVFGRAREITDQDVANYVAALETVIQALEQL